MAAVTQPNQAEPATARLDHKETEVGSVFVSNYPPYSFWSSSAADLAHDALQQKPAEDNSLGLYLHIPFCRKRCKFCYFRVYTDKNSNQIATYLAALSREVELYSELPSVQGRPLKFVYFGGGTPSYISVRHLKKLVRSLKRALPWTHAQEVAFECEPGTLSESKLETLRDIGVTRLSLGIENFNDSILRENGRAHLSREIYEVLPMIERLQFGQVNIDLIAGMVGETWETWKDNVKQILQIQPDSVTVYQMELPFNTVYTKMLADGSTSVHVADWQTKRDWHQYAFDELAAVGYQPSSAYTMVKSSASTFIYRNSVWTGTDMLGTGVASFGHMNHVHMQNVPSWNDYLSAIDAGKLPIGRAFSPDLEERLVREMILQLKLGKIHSRYFEAKFNVDIIDRFSAPYEKLRKEGMLTMSGGEIKLTNDGLLRVDQLLSEFYATKYQNARYT